MQDMSRNHMCRLAGAIDLRLDSSTVETEQHALLAPNPQQTGRCRGVASYVKESSNKYSAMLQQVDWGE